MKVPRVCRSFLVSIGDYLENVRRELVHCLSLSVGDPGDPDNLVLRMDHLHSQTHATAARSHKKIRLFPKDQVFDLSHRHIGLCLSVSSEIFEFLPEDSPCGVDFVNRHFDTGHGGFRVHVAAAGKIVNGPELDGLLGKGVPDDS